MLLVITVNIDDFMLQVMIDCVIQYGCATFRF